jgi:hypothetical protein
MKIKHAEKGTAKPGTKRTVAAKVKPKAEISEKRKAQAKAMPPTKSSL